MNVCSDFILTFLRWPPGFTELGSGLGSCSWIRLYQTASTVSTPIIDMTSATATWLCWRCSWTAFDNDDGSERYCYFKFTQYSNINNFTENEVVKYSTMQNSLEAPAVWFSLIILRWCRLRAELISRQNITLDRFRVMEMLTRYLLLQ